MTSSFLIPALDVLVIIALGATAVQVMNLARQVKTLKQSRSEMDRHLSQLGEAASRAELALSALRHAAGDSGRQLEGQVSEARELVEELRFMAEAADRIATRLEKGAASSSLRDSEAGEGFSRAPSASVHDEPLTLSTPLAGKGPDSLAAMEGRIRDRARDYLEKLSAGLSPRHAAAGAQKKGKGLKSRAERELAEALEGRRPQ